MSDRGCGEKEGTWNKRGGGGWFQWFAALSLSSSGQIAMAALVCGLHWANAMAAIDKLAITRNHSLIALSFFLLLFLAPSLSQFASIRTVACRLALTVQCAQWCANIKSNTLAYPSVPSWIPFTLHFHFTLSSGPQNIMVAHRKHTCNTHSHTHTQKAKANEAEIIN